MTQDLGTAVKIIAGSIIAAGGFSALTFNTISVTSSLTPLIELNSCKTPSICIAVTAAPLIEESKILLKEFPIVSA